MQSAEGPIAVPVVTQSWHKQAYTIYLHNLAAGMQTGIIVEQMITQYISLSNL